MKAFSHKNGNAACCRKSEVDVNIKVAGSVVVEIKLEVVLDMSAWKAKLTDRKVRKVPVSTRINMSKSSSWIF